MHDEELAAGGVGMLGSRHGEHALRVLQGVIHTVCGELALNAVAGTAHTCSVGASALNHEALDYAVEDQTVVELPVDQTDKIIYGNGRNVRI